jgi:hypothetical protein
MDRNNLNVFFRENVEAKRTEIEIQASDRFKDKEGNTIPFVFRLLEAKEISELKEKGYETDQNGNIKVTTSKMARETILRSIIFPNLNDKALQDSYKVSSAGQLLNAMLEGREYEKLGDKLVREQGLVADYKELINKAKN